MTAADLKPWWLYLMLALGVGFVARNVAGDSWGHVLRTVFGYALLAAYTHEVRKP